MNRLTLASFRAAFSRVALSISTSPSSASSSSWVDEGGTEDAQDAFDDRARLAEGADDVAWEGPDGRGRLDEEAMLDIMRGE